MSGAALGFGVAVGFAVAEGVAVGLTVGFGVAVGFAVAEGVAVGFIVGFGVAVGFAVSEGVAVGFTVGLGVVVGFAVAEGVAVGFIVGRASDVTQGRRGGTGRMRGGRQPLPEETQTMQAATQGRKRIIFIPPFPAGGRVADAFPACVERICSLSKKVNDGSWKRREIQEKLRF